MYVWIYIYMSLSLSLSHAQNPQAVCGPNPNVIGSIPLHLAYLAGCSQDLIQPIKVMSRAKPGSPLSTKRRRLGTRCTPTIVILKRKMNNILGTWGTVTLYCTLFLIGQIHLIIFFELCFMMNSPLARLEKRHLWLWHLYKLPEASSGCPPNIKIGPNCVSFKKDRPYCWPVESLNWTQGATMESENI